MRMMQIGKIKKNTLKEKTSFLVDQPLSGGKGNGNLLQCSCVENPRDGGAWWAAISGVAQSRT